MYEFSHRVEVNPDKKSAKLSRDELWRGLEMKAENAVPFVSGMESCEVLERTESGLIREANYCAPIIREKITFDESSQLIPSLQARLHQVSGSSSKSNTSCSTARELKISSAS